LKAMDTAAFGEVSICLLWASLEAMLENSFPGAAAADRDGWRVQSNPIVQWRSRSQTLLQVVVVAGVLLLSPSTHTHTQGPSQRARAGVVSCQPFPFVVPRVAGKSLCSGRGAFHSLPCS